MGVYLCFFSKLMISSIIPKGYMIIVNNQNKYWKGVEKLIEGMNELSEIIE